MILETHWKVYLLSICHFPEIDLSNDFQIVASLIKLKRFKIFSSTLQEEGCGTVKEGACSEALTVPLPFQMR